MPTRIQRTPRLSTQAMPAVSPWLRSWFVHYSRWYLRRHFHRLRLSTEGWLPDTPCSLPKVIYLNHASWWDPLVCLVLWHRLFPRHEAYAPIDSQALEKYAFFRRLGFFGVTPDSREGAAAFLRTARAICRRSSTVLWVTPQGRFADVRERPVTLKNGLGHLAARLARPDRCSGDGSPVDRVQFLPLAIEYTHWEERLPEVLMQFGQPIEVRLARQDSTISPQSWSHRFASALEDTMDQLSLQARRRDPTRFMPLLSGRVGVGGIYDLWRRMKSRLQYLPPDLRHGQL